MIEGNLKDVSLPALFQFLAAEAGKNYRVSVASNGQTGEVYVCKGFVVCAAYGLLEGEDAMCEFLAWRDGTFFVEQLTPQVDVRRNLKRAIPPTTAFTENAAYLSENNVGLTTNLVASKGFRTLEWQDSLKQQPLEREDFVVVGWLAEGRTMRQALREFNFDVAQATAILARLCRSNSVDPQRPVSADTMPPQPALQVDPVMQRYITTGGQSGAAARFAQVAAQALSPEQGISQDAFISTSFRPDVESLPEPSLPEPKAGKRQFFDPLKKFGMDIAQVRASVEARLRVRTMRSTSDERVDVATAKDTPLPEPVTRPAPERQSTSKTNLEPTRAPLPTGGSFGPDGSGSNWAPVGAPNQPVSNSGSKYGAVPGGEASAPVAEPITDSGRVTASDLAMLAQEYAQPEHHPASAMDTSDLLMPIQQLAIESTDQLLDEDRANISESVKAFTSAGYPPLPNAAQPPPQVVQESSSKDSELRDKQMSSAEAAVVAAAAAMSDERSVARKRTEVLPMVSIDIDRLLSATFSPTQFGKLALKNPALDPFRRQTLLDAEAGRSLGESILEGVRPPAGILNSYRYCLDRGYIETKDPVVPLTVDLLLGRMEIDQYLLQRRRITGDQLRDLIEMARKEGIKLVFVLVRGGYLTQADLDTLEREQTRFALK